MSNNKKINQHDLRKAMQDLKKKTSQVKRIESPLAKYTDAGQLMCIVCKTNIRSEAVWVVHLNSKSHKENLAQTKKVLESKESTKKTQTSPIKRPCTLLNDAVPTKKVKSILKNSGNIQQAPLALPTDFFDKSASQGIPAVASVTKPENVVASNGENTRDPASASANDVKAGESSVAAALPEGFYDDPILDAKVRNVEYKDPMDEEYDRFTKEIKEEAAQSAQMMAEDEEEATSERQFQEIDEQIGHWSRVMNLVKHKEKIQPVAKKSEPMNEDESSADEDDFDEFLDWRAKNSFK